MLVTEYPLPMTTIRPGVTAAKSGCATGTREPSPSRNTNGLVSRCKRSRIEFVFIGRLIVGGGDFVRKETAQWPNLDGARLCEPQRVKGGRLLNLTLSVC